MNRFNHIATSTPGMVSTLLIWEEWLSKNKELKAARVHIEAAISALTSLNEILIESESNGLKENESD